MSVRELAFENNPQIPFFDSFASLNLFIFRAKVILQFFFIIQSLFLMLFQDQIKAYQFTRVFVIGDLVDLFVLQIMQLIDKDFVGKCLPFLLFFKLEIMLFENHHRGREIDLQTFSTLRKFVFFILGLEEILANFDLVSFFYQFTMSFKQCVYGFFSALLFLS